MASHGYHKIKKGVKAKSKKTGIDLWIYLAVIIAPVMTIPQVYSIWINKEKGVSLITWAAYLFTSIIWLMYGIKHRDLPLIMVYISWVILESLIVIGIVALN